MDNQGVYILDGYVPFMGVRNYFSSFGKYMQKGFDFFERGLKNTLSKLVKKRFL